MSEEELDNIRAGSYIVGQASANEDAAEYMRSECGKMFARGRDQEAGLLRNYAAYFDNLAKTLRKKQEEYK